LTAAVVMVSTPAASPDVKAGTAPGARLSTACDARSSNRPFCHAYSMRMSRGVSTVKRAKPSDASTTAAGAASGTTGDSSGRLA
jgi:hypothetical protein